VDLKQIQRTEHLSGQFLIVNCWCGSAECAGIRKGIRVTCDSKRVHWVVSDLPPQRRSTQTFYFSREQYAAAIEHGINEMKKMATQTGLRVVPSQNARPLA
jgi:hypothetical protein